MVQARTRQAQWLPRFHKKKAALGKLGAALRALGVAHNFKYHGLDGATQLFGDLLLFAFRQSRRDIVCAVALLVGGISALAELEVRRPCARPADVAGFTRLETMRQRPLTEHRHR